MLIIASGTTVSKNRQDLQLDLSVFAPAVHLLTQLFSLFLELCWILLSLYTHLFVNYYGHKIQR